MDQGPLVASHLTDGLRFLERLAEEGISVTAACWIKESDSGYWYLYLATSLVDEDEDTKPAYRRLSSLIRMMPQPFGIDSEELKAIPASSPLVGAVNRWLTSYPGKVTLSVKDCMLGEVFATAAYLYAPVVVTTR